MPNSVSYTRLCYICKEYIAPSGYIVFTRDQDGMIHSAHKECRDSDLASSLKLLEKSIAANPKG